MKTKNLTDEDLNLRLCALGALSQAVGQIWPETKFGLYRMTDAGFSCDFDVGTTISEKQFAEIEDALILDTEGLSFEPASREEVLQCLKKGRQDYLSEHYEKQPVDEFICYKRGQFQLPLTDRPTKTAEPVHFKIVKVGGVYWQNDAQKPQLQRLEAVVFRTREELQVYLEREVVDHRQLGLQHNLFMFSETVGAGLPLWLENGATIRRQLENFIIDEEIKRGYSHVYTPDITHIGLYEISGHYPYYKDSMYAPLDIEGQRFMLRPMTCPHHFQIYKQKPRTFKELPIRLAELATLYRREQSGELYGLMRVRCFTLADAHIICRPDQVESELNSALQLIEDVADVLGLERYRDYSYRLSLGDRQNETKYFKDDKAWQQAEDSLRAVLKQRGTQFVEAPDEAAFYGPKIDIQMRNQNGQEETILTVQYDFVMPKRFKLTYLDADQKVREAAVIHRSSIGAIERLVAFLIEFYQCKFPVWLSPCQLKILTISDDSRLLESAESLQQQARQAKIRVQIDSGNRSIAKKIRQSQLEFIPYVLVLGEQELKDSRYHLKVRGDLKTAADKTYDFSQIIELIRQDTEAFR